MPRPSDVGVGVAALILSQDQRILLGKRKGSHRSGYWAAPGGWIDRPDNSTELTVIREVLEEVGILVRKTSQLCWTTEDHPELGTRGVTLYHEVDPFDWSGKVENREPDKCEEWAWFELSDLPTPIFPGLEEALRDLSELVRARSLLKSIAHV